MNTFSHISIGNLICDYLKTREKISLKKLSFVFGNIKPDLTAKLLKHPHYKQSLNDFVRSELLYLSKTYLEDAANIDNAYSERIGIICHYIADFFCLAHNDRYNDSIWTHILYEKRLSDYMRKHKRILKNIEFLKEYKSFDSVDDLCREIEVQHAAYLHCVPSAGMDILYAIGLCTLIVTAMVRFSTQYYKKHEEAVYENRLFYRHVLS